MRCIDAGRARFAPALMTIMLAAACADAPTAPPAARAPSPPRPLASLSSSADASALTIWDEDGTRYTLYPSLSEIHASDGTVFELTATELADAMNAFLAAYEGDQTSNALASPPLPSEPGCGVVLDGCTPEYGYSVGGPGPEPVPDDGTWPTPTPDTVIVRRVDPGAATPPSGGEGASYFVGSCQDIATAIYDANLRHRASRGAVINVLKTAVAVTVASNNFDLRIKIANIQGLGFKLETAAHDQLTRTTQLNVLATLYSAYGCWSSSWGSAGTVGGTPVPPPSPLFRNCRKEFWEVYLNGAYVLREVFVCEYYMD